PRRRTLRRSYSCIIRHRRPPAAPTRALGIVRYLACRSLSAIDASTSLAGVVPFALRSPLRCCPRCCPRKWREPDGPCALPLVAGGRLSPAHGRLRGARPGDYCPSLLTPGGSIARRDPEVHHPCPAQPHPQLCALGLRRYDRRWGRARRDPRHRARLRRRE